MRARFNGGPVWVVLLTLLAMTTDAGDSSAPAEPRWIEVHRQLSLQRDAFVADLESARERLLAQVDLQGDLARRLRDEPLAPRETGYQVLPELQADEPELRVEPEEQRYSLELLGAQFEVDFSLAPRLNERAEAPTDADALEPLVAELERLRESLELLEDHLAYHAYWQGAVVDYPVFFAKKNKVVARVQRLVELLAEEKSEERAAALRAHILDELAPFRPTPGLRLLPATESGVRVLAVAVATDIVDDAFLEEFRQAVSDTYTGSGAAQAAGLAIEVRWDRVAPALLYPEGVPPRGTAIDVDAHVARFGDRPLLLTSGADSTYSLPSQGIVLGSSPLNRRTLAHEFGHLLGFDDAYLRGFEGDPAGPFGVTLVEWTGLSGDLMGDAEAGQVTPEMIRRLLRAYGRDPEPRP